MERWEKEAKFVLDLLKKDDELMFSEDDAEHTKRKKHDEFVKEWGFSYNDMFDLDNSIAMFILPRIAYFLKNNIGIPSVLTKIADDGTIENEEQARQQWNGILETICDGLHLYLAKSFGDFTDEEKELWNNAKKYLFEYFECLWN
jgi:hypothetical protein